MNAADLHGSIQADSAMQLRPVSIRSRLLLASLVAGLPLLGLFVLPALSGDPAPGGDDTAAWVIPASAVFCIVLAAVLDWSLRRHRLRLDDAGLEVTTSFYRRQLALTQLRIDQARVVDLGERTELRPILRTNGTGLPGFKSGWFRLRNHGKALVATVGGNRVLWLPTTAGFDLLLEPRRPQALLDRLKQMAPPARRG